MGAHDALADRILAAITVKGADVVFTGAADTPEVYDPATDTWSGGSASGDVTGKAVQTKSDPDRWTTFGLVLSNPVRLLIAGKDLGTTPRPGMAMVWAGTTYSVKLAEPHGPDGSALYYDVVGSV